MAFSLALLPMLAGALLWAVGHRVPAARRRRRVGTATAAVLLVVLALAVRTALTEAAGTYALGAGLELVVGLSAPAGAVAVLVPAVGAVVATYAAGHEPVDGLPRLLGLLTVFVGAMQLLVTAADLLTLLVGFELVGALSWTLIGHRWREASAPRAAAHALNATRLGGLGLFLAAGAALAATGSLRFDALTTLQGTSLHVVTGGVLLAAAAKSAQGPFAPWLFSAMAGPTPVSALLHSATMVGAGAYVLVRLHPVLDAAGWFAPAVVTLGLATALAGGVVALLQSHAKRLLAASTSAQYGLMLVAVGVGEPAVALVHLVVHAVLKAQLFLAAGVAIHAAGSEQLGRMRLGRRLRATAALAAVGSLALAGVPPLGGALSKELVVGAAGHEGAWLAALVVLAGGLSAAYATRFQVLAFGRDRGPRRPPTSPSWAPHGALALLAAGSLALGALWLPAAQAAVEPLAGGRLVAVRPREVAVSLLVVGLAVATTWSLDRRRRLVGPGAADVTAGPADWLGLPAATRRLLVDPTLGLARGLARLDDRVVDGGVSRLAGGGARVAGVLAGRVEPRIDGAVGGVAGGGRLLARAGTRLAERGVDGAVAGVAWTVTRAGTGARRIQTGMVHHQFVVVAVGLALVALAVVAGR